MIKTYNQFLNEGYQFDESVPQEIKDLNLTNRSNNEKWKTVQKMIGEKLFELTYPTDKDWESEVKKRQAEQKVSGWKTFILAKDEEIMELGRRVIYGGFYTSQNARTKTAQIENVDAFFKYLGRENAKKEQAARNDAFWLDNADRKKELEEALNNFREEYDKVYEECLVYLKGIFGKDVQEHAHLSFDKAYKAKAMTLRFEIFGEIELKYGAPSRGSIAMSALTNEEYISMLESKKIFTLKLRDVELDFNDEPEKTAQTLEWFAKLNNKKFQKDLSDNLDSYLNKMLILEVNAAEAEKELNANH